MRSLLGAFIGTALSSASVGAAWFFIQESSIPVFLVLTIVALFNYIVGLLIMLNLTLIKRTENE